MLISDKLDDIVTVLRRGGVILYPTDTIWGLGCDSYNVAAIEKIYTLKERDTNKPMLLLVSGIPMLKKYVAKLHPRIETLLSYHNKPLTIIYDSSTELPSFAKAQDGTIAIRIVKDPFCRTIIMSLGRPLISTSANKTNQEYPRNFGEISSEIIREVDYVVKYRQNEKAPSMPSVLAKYNEKGDLEFLRG